MYLYECGCAGDTEFCVDHDKKWLVNSLTTRNGPRKVRETTFDTLRLVYGPARRLPEGKYDFMLIEGYVPSLKVNVPYVCYGVLDDIKRTVRNFDIKPKGKVKLRSKHVAWSNAADAISKPVGNVYDVIASMGYKRILHVNAQSLRLAAFCLADGIDYAAQTSNPCIGSAFASKETFTVLTTGVELCGKETRKFLTLSTGTTF